MKMEGFDYTQVSVDKETVKDFNKWESVFLRNLGLQF